MERLDIILSRFLTYSLISIFCLACSSSPRYRSSSNPSPIVAKKQKDKSQKQDRKNNNKQSKFDKSKKVFRGISSYYGPQFHGKLTANGEIFDMYGVTAAHKEIPFNTTVRVTNENNGKSLLLRINDRGPYIDNRILDCSFGAAKKLGFVGEGTAPVKIEVIEWGDGVYMHHD